MFSDCKLAKIFNNLSITIPDELLSIALTHSSKTFEDSTSKNYERLEFLGDSVLKLAISEFLYTKYPEYNEGRMTKIRGILVSDSTLFEISKKIDLKNLIIMGKKEEKDGGRNKESIIACAFEAILGAIYLSSGLGKANKFITFIFDKLPYEIDKNLDFYNAKAVLQEYTQDKNKDLPKYIELNENGKAHNKIFTFGVYYNNELLASGSGKTKKDAQQEAAKKACINLGILKES